MTSIERYTGQTPEQTPETPSTLTVEDVARRLADGAAEAADPEAAHGMEDELHQAVLRVIAAGHPDAQILAAAALRTNDLGFERWYA